MAAVGAGSSSKEELAEGEIAADGGGGEGSSALQKESSRKARSLRMAAGE